MDLGRVRLIVSDVDGTLTVSRRSFRLSCRALSAIEKLEECGVRVGLASGNSLPVLAGLARYLGASGPIIAENGCLAMARPGGVIELCRSSAREAVEVIGRRLGLEPSWQNKFRVFDHALVVVGKPREYVKELTRRANKLLKELGYRNLYAFSSGYAIHIHPVEADKGVALRRVVEHMGLDRSVVAAIGDSVLDLPLLREAGVAVAVGDADEELRKVAKLVVRSEAGEGFAEFAEMVLRARGCGQRGD